MEGLPAAGRSAKVEAASEFLSESEPEDFRGQTRRVPGQARNDARAELDVLEGLSNEVRSQKDPAMSEGGF